MKTVLLFGNTKLVKRGRKGERKKEKHTEREISK